MVARKKAVTVTEGTRALALINRASAALDEAKTISEIKYLISMAKAAEVFAKQMKAAKHVVDQGTDLKFRAQRKLGEVLAQTPKAKGRSGQVRGATAGRGSKPLRAVDTDDLPQDEPSTLAQLGLTKDESSLSQRLAALPVEKFETAVAAAKEGGSRGAKRVLIDAKREEKHEKIKKASKKVGAMPAEQRFSVVLADPAWQFDNESPASRRATNQYPCMETAAIMALCPPVADQAVLYLWATSAHLPDALRVMSAWGFEYRTNAVWVKDRIGQGWWVRNRHELLLIGARGKMPPPLPTGRTDSVIEAPRGRHSVKPVEVYEMIERAYPGCAYLELFARSARAGWTSWGYEA